MSCDMRFASTQAIFNQPEVALGIVPGGCGMTRLPRLINRSRALEVMLGCDDIDAITVNSNKLAQLLDIFGEIPLDVERHYGHFDQI